MTAHAHEEDEDLQPDYAVLRGYTEFKSTLGEFPDCCPDIKRSGTVVMVSACGKDINEAVCSELRRRGHRVDWHWVRGRAFIKTLDDPSKIETLFWNLATK